MREEQIAKVHDHRLQRQQDGIDRWRGTPAERGHAAFFQLGADLRRTGMTMPEIETTLWQEAGHARHPAERRSQIKSIMRTLSRGIDRAAA